MRHMLRPHVGARPSALSAYAHWKLDELTTGNATDSVGPYTLTATDAPGVAGSLFAVPPGTTGARTFNGTTQILQNFVNSASLTAALANEGAVSLVFKADALSGTHALFTYEGLTASSAQDENKIISIYIYLDEIKVQWEYGSGTLVDSTTSGLGLDLTEFLLVVSWSGETTKTLNVYVFDRGGGLYFEQEFTGLTGANGGENADITLACGRDNTLYFDGTMDDVVLWKLQFKN